MTFWCKKGGIRKGFKKPVPPRFTLVLRYHVPKRDSVVGQMLIFWLPQWAAIHHNGKSTGGTPSYIFTVRIPHIARHGHRRIFRGQCSYLLRPRLFRGVTPYRHDGESLVRAMTRWLAHSGYPFGDKEHQGTPPDRCDACAIRRIQCGDDAPLIHRLYF